MSSQKKCKHNRIHISLNTTLTFDQSRKGPIYAPASDQRPRHVFIALLPRFLTWEVTKTSLRRRSPLKRRSYALRIHSAPAGSTPAAGTIATTDNWVITNPEKMSTCQPYDARQGWTRPCKHKSRENSAKSSKATAIDVEMSGPDSAQDRNTAEAALSKTRKGNQRRLKRKQIRKRSRKGVQ